jgi:3-methyladenine DNA glycosylase AlkD
MYKKITKEIISRRSIDKGIFLARFFKTGSGQYGEGDLFLGITVPESRKIAVKYCNISLLDISQLIINKYHEVRLIALLILVNQYRKNHNENERKKIYNFYLKNTKNINNWDLVDLSAHYIIGEYLINKDRKILEKLAKSKNLWERRIAIISTFAFIYKGESEWTFRIVKILLNDKQDLIHKACGWMLREVGKRVSEKELTSFLDIYVHQMPRTMLRYSIERLPDKKRLYYLNRS